MAVNLPKINLALMFSNGFSEKTDAEQIMDNTSANFRYSRKCIGLSQKDIITEMRNKAHIITADFLIKLEKNRTTNPDLIKLIALANHYKIPLKEIMFTKPADFKKRYV